MSKIRKKAKLKKIDGSYPERSGVLSKSIKKIIQDEDIKQGKLPAEFLFSPNELINKTKKIGQYDSRLLTQWPKFYRDRHFLNREIFFNDENQFNLNSQKINPVLGVSSSYINNTNIFVEGNHFATGSDFEILQKPTLNNLDYYKLNENKYEENYSSFSEGLKTEKSNNYSEIIIDLPFENDLILDNLKHCESFTFRQDSSFSTQKYIDWEKTVCYYNFNTLSWDYKWLTDIVAQESDYLIPLFTPPQIPSDLISSSSIGMPTSTFTFPYGGQHKGGPQNYINLKNYITKPFVLEKIIVETVLTSRAENVDSTSILNTNPFKYNPNVDLANMLNFYMLRNVRANVNTEIFSLKDNAAFDKIKYFAYNFNTKTTKTANHTLSTDFFDYASFVKANPEPGFNSISNLKTNDFNNAGYSDWYSTIVTGLDNDSLTSDIVTNDGLFNTSLSSNKVENVSELITYANFVTYNNYSREASNIDWNTALSEIDLVKKIDTGTNYLDANLNFTSSSIKIESNCRFPESYKNGYPVDVRDGNIGNSANHHVYMLSNEKAGRTGIGTLTGREYEGSSIVTKAKIIKSEEIYQNISGDSINFNHISSGSFKSPYVLMPDDEILFGIHSWSNMLEFPALFKLHDKVRFRLIGRYENLEDDNITSSNKQGMTSNSVRSTIIGNTTVVNQYDTEPVYFMSGSYLDNRFTGDIKSSSGRTIEGSLSSGLSGSFTRTVTLEDTENTIYDSMMPSILDIMKANNKNIWSNIIYDGTFGSNRLYFVNQRRWNADSHNPPTSYNPWASEEFYNWGGSFEEWIYDFPFKDEYSNLARFLNLDLDASIRNTEWEDLSTELASLMTEFHTQTNYEATITQGQTSVTITNGLSLGVIANTGANLIVGSGPGSFGSNATISSITDSGGGTGTQFDTSVPHATSGNIVFKVDNGTRDIARFNPGGSLNFNVIGKGGVSTGGHLYSFDATNLRVLNKFLFSNIRVFDFPKSDVSSFYGHALKSSIAGNSNAVGTYGNPPIAGFKYGVYNPNPVSLTKHFNWRSYGQFSDRYNGTIDTAIFNQDKPVRYPIEKTFVDSEQNSIEASSVADTYNTDEYARSGRPFFD